VLDCIIQFTPSQCSFGIVGFPLQKLERLKLDAVTQILRRGGRYVTSLEFRNFIRHDDDCPALVSALKSLTSLTYLSVGFDSFFKLMPDLKSVLTMENLKFKLSSDHARVARRCKELAVLLQDLLSCTHLDFTHQKIDDRGMPDLVPALASLHALTHLNLHDNNIGDYSCYTLSEALLQLTSLTHLDLGTNLISDSGCVFLCKSLSNMTSLTFLDLNWNLLLRSGSLLAHTFTNLTSLQHLAVSGMPGQYETEAPALISLLCTLRQLTHLDLNSNRLTVSSCRALAEVLPNFEKLQTLKLYVNEIDDAGCLALSSVLNRLPFLSVLDLSQNRIGDEGFRALASALSSMPTLTQFFVDRNQNTEDGCRAVAPVIASLTDVVSWDLGHGNRVHHTSCATCKQLAAVRVVTVPRPQSNYVEEDPIGW
jgi:Ran GTPase-activating protein (RanGAP) involved in mRNA processing and transport